MQPQQDDRQVVKGFAVSSGEALLGMFAGRLTTPHNNINEALVTGLIGIMAILLLLYGYSK